MYHSHEKIVSLFILLLTNGNNYVIYHNPIVTLFQLPLIMPIILLILYAALLALTVYRKPLDSLFATLVMLAGIPLFLFGVVWTKKPSGLQNVIGKVLTILDKQTQ